MPLWTGDYLSKTSRLSTLEHGAYLLLIIEYWEHGGLPDDDRQLAHITKLTIKKWKYVKPILQGFFYNGWHHKKVEEELSKSADLSEKRRDAAMQKHSNSSAIADASEEQLHPQLHTHSPSHSPNVNDIKKEINGNGMPPPIHGQKNRDGKLVFMKPGNQDFSDYENDFIEVRNHPPNLDKHGGYWFWIAGEALRPKNYRTIPKKGK